MLSRPCYDYCKPGFCPESTICPSHLHLPVKKLPRLIYIPLQKGRLRRAERGLGNHAMTRRLLEPAPRALFLHALNLSVSVSL